MLTDLYDHSNMVIMYKLMSKSEFKPKSLEYLRKVEKSKVPLILTHNGKPVVKITAYNESDQTILQELHGSVASYEKPTEPVDVDWQVLK